MAGWNLYIAGGWLMAAAGLVTIILYAFGRRVLVRRTPRCIACGYRLEGVPATDTPARCPECGRIPRGIAEPYALGRKRWIGLLGVFLLTAGLALPSVPVIRAQGWTAALPIGVQARLLPFSGDDRLWIRVAAAAELDRLSARAMGNLRAQVLARMVDPTINPTPAMGAFDYVMRSRNKGLPAYDREELLRILSSGAPAARSRALAHVGGRAPPQGEEITLRRDAWHAAPVAERWRLLEWFAMHPVDDEDLAIIRSTFETEPWRAASSVDRVLKDASPATHQLILELFDHPQPPVRQSALMVVEDWLRGRDNKPPKEIQAAVLRAGAQDPDPGVFRMAYRSMENLAVEFGPEIGEALASTTDPRRFDGLLYAARRKNDAGVLAGLAKAAAQIDRPLAQRAEAAQAYIAVRARTRQTTDIPDFSDVYASVVDGFMLGDPELLLRIGPHSSLSRTRGMVLAVLDRAGADGVPPEGLASWLAEQPALTAFFQLAEPVATTPREALAEFVLHVWKGQPTDDRLEAAVAHWFPEIMQEGSGD